VKDCFLANCWKYSTQYVAMKTAQNDFYYCTFSCYNCTIRHQLHTKICPGHQNSAVNCFENGVYIFSYVVWNVIKLTDIFSEVQLEKRFSLATLLHLTMAVTIGAGHGKSGFRRTCRKALISVKRGKIGPRLLLRTNRKSHTRFRLVPKSTTLDDLEGSLCTLFQNTCCMMLLVSYL